MIKKQVPTIRISLELHSRLRILAARKGTKINDETERALLTHLVKEERRWT